MPGTSAIGGLVSGLDTSNLIEQLVGVSRKRVDLVVTNQTKQSDKLAAFQGLNTQLTAFLAKADVLRESDTFDVFKTSTSTTSTTFTADELVTVSATEEASPGTHTVTYTAGSQLAQARQLSSASFSSKSTGLNLTGEFLINGQTISIVTSDSLADIASTINTANSGTDATGVTASLISVSDTDNRMILTSDNTGKDQFVILDASISTGGDANILQTLGYTDGTTTIKNPTSDGAKSEAFSSSTSAIGSLLGLSSPQNSSTVQINGNNITIDLATDSLTDIATTISAVGGVTASVVSTTTEGVTTYQLDISGTINFTDSNNILEAVGVLEGGQSTVAEVHTASADNYNLSNAVIDSTTKFNNIYTGLISSAANTLTAGGNIVAGSTFGAINTTGGPGNDITNLDTISISGTKQDGTAVGAYNFTITDKATTTVQDLLTNIETNFDLTTGSVVIDSAGKIQINDNYSGDSQLSIAFVESAGLLDFGTYAADNNVANGDKIFLTGTDSTGSAVTGTFTITDTNVDTIDGLLTQIETVFGLGASSATVDSNGQIIITDDSAGDSQLSVTIQTDNAGGGTLDFGTVDITTEGYGMESTAGQDVKVVIDGVAVTRSSNSIDDVISGVTLDIARVDTSDFSTVNITISRDTDSIKGKVNEFTDSYNEIMENINQHFAYNEETKKAGVLSGESTLRTIKSIIQNTISNAIPLLPADSNSLPLIGITSDKYGKLSVKDSTFLTKINSDFNAVKRLFVAEGTTTNSEITYVSHTKNTVGGEFAVTINTVASQATETGTQVLTNGIGAGLTDTLTITDTSSGRVATISLDGDAESGNSIDNIVNTINSELGTDRTQVLAGLNAQTQITGGAPITATTKFNEIDTTGGPGTDLNNNDIIYYSGTTRSGLSISDSYTISNVSTDTVQNFLSAIENAYDNQVKATINSSGKIVVTDSTIGDSQLSISITEPGGLDFGTVLETNVADGGVNGRFAMEITASKDGSDKLVLTHDSYGSAFGFTTTEASALLGTVGTYTGVDVVGSINGEAATGTGQTLVGDAPPDISSSTSIEGLTIEVTSTTTGSKGNVRLTMGVGEMMYNNVDSVTDQFDGLLTIRMDGLQDTIDDMQDSVVAMEKRLAMETLRLNKTFVALELNLSKLQSVSSFMAQQLGQLSK
ncbi:MAG: flagellar filament capping protein FliD [Candidatus Scalindua sp.]|nr:flagellar filament capping protein FliD [Candidatus Scalindua sp.]